MWKQKQNCEDGGGVFIFAKIWDGRERKTFVYIPRWEIPNNECGMQVNLIVNNKSLEEAITLVNRVGPSIP